MSKGIVISGPAPTKLTQTTNSISETPPTQAPEPEKKPDAERASSESLPAARPQTKEKVLVTPIEEIEYQEQDLKQLVTPNKQGQNQQPEIESDILLFHLAF